MPDWIALDPLKKIDLKIHQRVVIAAWEFGCEPEYFICRFWQSSLDNQPPKFHLDETYHSPVPFQVGVVHYYMPLELPESENSNA